MTSSPLEGILLNYLERTVRSAPNLSQEDALDSLQSHPNFRPGTKIASLRRRGERWVATLHIPKTAGGFPPGGDELDEGPPKPKAGPEDGPDDGAPDDGPEGLPGMDGPPDGPPGADGEKKPGKGGAETEILHVLTEILHALKGGPVGPEMGGPDDMGPGPDAMGGPPPHGGPGLPPPGPPKPGAMGIGAKLKPGEVPNKPGVVPIGAPAFSSANPLYQRIAKVAGRQRHIPVSSPVGMSIKQAKTELDPIAAHFGYRVAQVKYCGPNCTCKAPGSSKVHALLAAQ